MGGAAVKAKITSGAVILFMLLSVSVSSEEVYPQYGNASWYGVSLHGSKTASEEPYDMHAFTGAHRKLPFGTVVRVKNLRNGKEVIVTVNDRGPFVRGRIIDISRAAASRIGIVGRGVVRVRLEVLSRPGD